MGEPKPHSVFQKEEDHYNWDKYLEQLKFIELSDFDRNRAAEAIGHLRGLFGEMFLKRCFDNRHPFYFELANSAPRARLWLIRFAELLQSLKGADGFKQIVARLKRTDQSDDFKEASTVVETAYKFHNEGFTVVFEPKLEIENVAGLKIPRKPDLKLIEPETAEVVIVEVSRLRESDKQITAGKSFDAIWFLIHGIIDNSMVTEVNREKNEQIHYHFLPYANILQHLDDDDLTKIIPKIKNLAQKVEQTNKFQELIIENKIEVAISPRHDHSLALEWSRKRRLRDLIESPQIPLHETHRMRMKIGKKIKQLPPDYPGIIIIPTHETLLFFAYSLDAIIDDVKTELLQYPQLMYVVLSLQAGESPKDSVAIAIKEHLFTKKTREDLITESHFLITNPAFNLKVSDSIVERITQAFINN